MLYSFQRFALETPYEALPQVFLHEAEPRSMHSSAEHRNEKKADG